MLTHVKVCFRSSFDILADEVRTFEDFAHDDDRVPQRLAISTGRSARRR